MRSALTLPHLQKRAPLGPYWTSVFNLRWLRRLVSYEMRGTVRARVTWLLIATYFYNYHMYYSYIWVEEWEIAEISPEKSDSKNLLVSPRGGFLYSVLFSQFSLDWSRQPFVFIMLIDSLKSKVLLYIWFMGTCDFVADFRLFWWGIP